MTTYILVGGEERSSKDYPLQLREIVEDIVTRNPVRVIACFFAKKGERYDDSLVQWLHWYHDHMPSWVVTVASEENFVEEIALSDVVYLHGGDNYQLLHQLQTYAEFTKSLSGKVIVASSAGANCLSKFFYSRTYDSVIEGLGILDIGLLVHYQSTGIKYATKWEDAERKLLSRAGGANILKLREGEMSVVEYEDN